jgi:hypothetical protein
MHTYDERTRANLIDNLVLAPHLGLPAEAILSSWRRLSDSERAILKARNAHYMGPEFAYCGYWGEGGI